MNKYRAKLELLIASFLAPALCLLLLIAGEQRQAGNDLLGAIILTATSIVILIVYFIGMFRLKKLIESYEKEKQVS